MLPKFEGIVHQLCVEVAEVAVARTAAARAIVEVKCIVGYVIIGMKETRKKERMSSPLFYNAEVGCCPFFQTPPGWTELSN
jgi:hypothetical protein